LRKSTGLKLVLESIRYIVAFYGFWQIIVILSPALIPLAQYLVAFALLVSLFFPLAYWFSRPPLLREYNLPPIRKEFLVTKQTIEVNIEKAGTVTNTIRDYVYLKQPEEKDLYDILYAVGEATPQSVGYRSPDSYQVDHEKEGRNKLKVYWKPKDEIVPYKTYSHTFYWTPPAILDEDLNYYFISPTYLNGETALEIRTHRPVQESMNFSTRRFFKEEEHVYRHAIFLSRTASPQPVIDPSRLSIRLQLLNPKPSVNNYLIWAHDKPITDAWLELADKKILQYKQNRIRRYFSLDYHKLQRAAEKTRAKNL